MSESNENIDKSLKKIAKISFIVFLTLLLAKVLNYTYRIIIARNYGPEYYGIFSISIVVFGLFSIIASLGFKGGIVRFISQYRAKGELKKINYLLNFASKVLLITSFISGILLFFLSEYISINYFHEPRLIIFLKVLSLLIPLKILSELFLSSLDAFERVDISSFIENILSSLLNLSFLLVLVFIGIKSNAIIFSFFLSYVFVFFISLWFYKKYILSQNITSKTNTNDKTLSEFFNYSWPIMFSGIINFLFAWIDTFSIGYLLDVKEVGIYNSAVPIVLLFTFIPTIIFQIYFPLINREYSLKNIDLVKELTKQVNKWILFINLPFFIILILFPELIISLLFGSDYIGAAESLRILSVGYFIFSFIASCQKLLLMDGKSKIILIDIILSSILNIILNIYFIPIYGISGAALATAISWIFLCIIWLFQVRYYFNSFPFRRKTINIFISAIIPILIGLSYKKSIYTNIILDYFVIFFILFLYVLLSLLFKVIDKNDLEIIKSITNKLSKIRNN